TSLPIYKPTLPHFTGRRRRPRYSYTPYTELTYSLSASSQSPPEERLDMEFEDDLFFADLSKQISLLIMDDDEEDPVSVSSSVSFQAYSISNYPTAVQSPFMYEQSCRRESKGTGVFIPQSSLPRRKQRQGRYSNPKGQRKQDNNTTRMVSQVSYSNSYSSKKG
ncbi:hypothetical protein LINGRAHAP2_LOCUS6531, partial [Linum grandiflorum]